MFFFLFTCINHDERNLSVWITTMDTENPFHQAIDSKFTVIMITDTIVKTLGDNKYIWL